VVIVAPIFEQRAPGLYHNSAIVIDADGRDLGLYRKMHIPDDPCFYEKFYFTPGDLGFKAFDTAYGRIGILICWDQWYPEGARLTALQGAEVLFYPTAIGWHPHEKAQHGAHQRSAWQTIQRAHAIANGCYVAAVNRVGHEIQEPGSPGLEFWGTSFVSDPFGVLLAEGSTDRRRFWSPPPTPPAWKRCAATGPSCATAALTPTAASPSVSWISPRGRMPKTPAQLGFFYPAEWERHHATWIGWPHNTSTGRASLVPCRGPSANWYEGFPPGNRCAFSSRTPPTRRRPAGSWANSDCQPGWT
jgi:predicted amidohydrolase